MTTRTPAEQRALEAAALRNEDAPMSRTAAETHAPIDDELVAWSTMVSRFLAWSEQPQASPRELEPHWTSGLLPIQAAARIIEERRGTGCDDTE